MRKIEFWFECGVPHYKETIEVEDDTTDDELQSMLNDVIGNQISAGWTEEGV